MNFSNEILLVILIGIVASATDTDLANNTNMLLLLLFILLRTACCPPLCPTPCPPACPPCPTSQGFLGTRTSFFM